jgi:RNA polymerase sigma-70 factor, ECF subfamily
LSVDCNAESAIRLPLKPSEATERLWQHGASHQEVISLFDELHNRLLRYVLSFGLSPADGEEIIQEAFLSLVKHLQQGRSRHNLRGWLFRVAHNQSLKRLASNERYRSVADADASAGELHPDPAPNPEEQVTFDQRQARLLAIMQALSPQDQQCLRLRAEGLRYREIAGVLGISLGSVSASLARSLERLGRGYER